MDRRQALRRVADLVRARRTALRRDKSKAALMARCSKKDLSLIENGSAHKVAPPAVVRVIGSLGLSEEEMAGIPILVGAIYLRRRRRFLARKNHFHRRSVCRYF